MNENTYSSLKSIRIQHLLLDYSVFLTEKSFMKDNVIFEDLTKAIESFIEQEFPDEHIFSK